MGRSSDDLIGKTEVQSNASRRKLDVALERIVMAAGENDQDLLVAVRVSLENYLPPEINIRAKITPRIFTAQILLSELSKLENDPFVISVCAADDIEPSSHP